MPDLGEKSSVRFVSPRGTRGYGSGRVVRSTPELLERADRLIAEGLRQLAASRRLLASRGVGE
jgi:hypothetical protein